MGETLVLSERERAILYSYRDTLEGLAEYLGGGYEIVLHCLESYEHSVIKIINGFHTGRTEGAPITNLALAMLSELKQQPGTPHAIVYFAQNRKGEPLKSTTIPILGDGDRIIGLICINFYMNTPLSELIRTMRPQEFMSPVSQNGEAFAESAEEMLALTLGEVIPEVRQDAALPRSVHNKEIVRRLWEKGVFDIKGSVDTVAEALKLSPNTVYLHLRNLTKANRT